jgi:drug/metabolite transporter (DMT)-like permease
MGLMSSLLAALFVAFSNLFMRKSIDSGGTTKAFLVIQMSIATIVAFGLGPVKTGSYDVNLPILVLGAISGTALAFMLSVLGKALEKGPPGLTFSILSAATVMPGIVMALMFGFPYTIWHGIGSLFVLGGLFWAGRGLEGMQDKKRWTFLVTLMFSLHVLILVIYQWRALLLSNPATAEQVQSQWFMPAMYGSAALIQLAIYLRSERRYPHPQEWLFGALGGVFNSLCTFFLIQATEQATAIQSAIIFPLFSIGTIFFSNIWSQKLYRERVNWRACQVCAFGILLGTVDWNALLKFLSG